MKKDIYKKGLILLSIIVIIAMTVTGYFISLKEDNTKIIVGEKTDYQENDEKVENEGINDKKEATQEALEKPKVMLTIDIAGAVKAPNIYSIENGLKIDDAINMAGGFTDDADKEYIDKTLNRALGLYDGQKIYIPRAGEDISAIDTAYVASDVNNTTLININTATKEQLMTLTGIGEAYAQRIIEYRQNTPFEAIEEIKNVKGIGDKKFEKIKDRITV